MSRPVSQVLYINAWQVCADSKGLIDLVEMHQERNRSNLLQAPRLLSQEGIKAAVLGVK